MTVELVQPLLEGLAMMTQMEGDWANDGWASLTITSLEYLYHQHRVLLAYPELAAALDNEEERKRFAEDLVDAFARQVSSSRTDVLEDLVDNMFLEEKGTEGSSAPYFYGYLYLRRLYQEWTRRMPELDFNTFYGLATKLVCALLPPTLLPFYSLRNLHFNGAQFPVLFRDLLMSFLSLSRSQIEFLRDTHELLIWNLATHQIEKLREQGPVTPDEQAEYEAELFTRILWYVFDLRKSGESSETRRVLDSIERAKFLINTGIRQVLVLGVDEEQNVAFIVDIGRKKSGSKIGQINFDQSGSTFFRFQDETVFRQFLEMFETGNNKLRRHRLGSGPYKFTAADYIVPAWLRTLCYLWPTEYRDSLLMSYLLRISSEYWFAAREPKQSFSYQDRLLMIWKARSNRATGSIHACSMASGRH